MSDEQDRGPRGSGRRLERAPGERYRRAPGATPPRTTPPGAADTRVTRRAIIAAVLVADAGALGLFLLSQVDLGAGLLAVAAFVGWATGLALIWWGRDAVAGHARPAVAALLAGWSVVLALVLDWAWSLVQGGALGPVDYAFARFGWVGPLAIAVAAGAAALRAR
jgi:hypothetical protein